MPTHEFLPLVERQAARAAIEQLVREHGSQGAAAYQLGISQNAINKAVLYTKIGPAVMRALLEHLKIDTKDLLARHGDPGAALVAEPPAPQAPRSNRDEAILAGVRYGNVRESDARAIADAYEVLLKDAPLVEWIETMMREIQKRHLLPAREEKAASRRTKSQQRILRNLNDAHERRGAEPTPGAVATEAKRATR